MSSHKTMVEEHDVGIVPSEAECSYRSQLTSIKLVKSYINILLTNILWWWSVELILMTLLPDFTSLEDRRQFGTASSSSKIKQRANVTEKHLGSLWESSPALRLPADRHPTIHVLNRPAPAPSGSVNNALTYDGSLTGAEQKWLCGQSRSSKQSQSPSVRERSQRDPYMQRKNLTKYFSKISELDLTFLIESSIKLKQCTEHCTNYL